MASSARSGEPEVTDIDEYLQNSKYFDCRAYGCSFRSDNPWWNEERVGRSVFWTKRFICPGCRRWRDDTRDSHNALVGRSYEKRDDYAVKGRRLTRTDVWEWVITQQAQQRGQRGRRRAR